MKDKVELKPWQKVIIGIGAVAVVFGCGPLTSAATNGNNVVGGEQAKAIDVSGLACGGKTSETVNLTEGDNKLGDTDLTVKTQDNAQIVQVSHDGVVTGFMAEGSATVANKDGKTFDIHAIKIQGIQTSIAPPPVQLEVSVLCGNSSDN